MSKVATTRRNIDDKEGKQAHTCTLIALRADEVVDKYSATGKLSVTGDAKYMLWWWEVCYEEDRGGEVEVYRSTSERGNGDRSSSQHPLFENHISTTFGLIFFFVRRAFDKVVSELGAI